MKKYIFVLLLGLLLIIGCSKSNQVRQPITRTRTESSAVRSYYPLPHDQFSLIILNGLPYQVKLGVIDNQQQPKTLGLGDQDKSLILKTHQPRFVVIGGKVFNENGVVGSVSTIVRIPPQDSHVEGGIWHITSFVKMEEAEEEEKPDIWIRLEKLEKRVK